MDRALARAPRWRAWWACAAALMQAACNGGGESVPTRLHATADSAGADFDAHALLDYAERVYPQFFPGPAIDQVSAPYIYRHYPATGNYVGVAGETVSVLGPLSGGNVHEVGRLGDFRCLAWPERCSRPQGPWVVAGPSSFALLGAGGEIRAWTRFDANDRLGLTTLPRSADGLTRTLGRAGSAVQLTASFGILLGDDRKGYIWGTGATTYAAEYSLAVSLPAAAPAPMNWPGPLQQLELDAGVRLGSVSGGVQTSGLPTALLADGTVWQSVAPQLTAQGWKASPPSRVEGLSGVVALSRGIGSLHALLADGRVVALHPDIGPPSSLIAGAGDVQALSCSSVHCLALRRDGTVLAWGRGPLGDGAANQSSYGTALPVSGLAGVLQVVATDAEPSTRQYSVALTRDGRVWQWGTLDAFLDPRLAPGQDDRLTFRPALVPALSEITDIACSRACIARRADGSLWAWGRNAYALMGVPDSTDFVSTPVRIPGVVLATGPASSAR